MDGEPNLLQNLEQFPPINSKNPNNPNPPSYANIIAASSKTQSFGSELDKLEKHGMPTVIFKATDYYGVMAAECRLTIFGKFLKPRPQIEKIRVIEIEGMLMWLQKWSAYFKPDEDLPIAPCKKLGHNKLHCRVLERIRATEKDKAEKDNRNGDEQAEDNNKIVEKNDDQCDSQKHEKSDD
ncbi:hypothetical protein H5410_005797 [Solanum commersonii]|uniref:DUF4283 domain-containing protein n=1 Tax=Solanum commersonii TaxID=4109 RepID=A0A9J6A8H2_SOLCO|nr:hypothetical protein H5410_005797 [Solanum commersonii]